MSWSSLAIALKIREAIVENTLAGKDKDGKPFKPYSTRPFKMPYGAISNKKKLKANRDNVRYFTNRKTGGLWVTWLKGYSDYKFMMRGNNRPNLQLSGGLLKSFSVLKVAEKGNSGRTSKLETSYGSFEVPIPAEVYIELGWKKEERGKIAYYNKLKGRDMLGLPQNQLENIVKEMVEKV